MDRLWSAYGLAFILCFLHRIIPVLKRMVLDTHAMFQEFRQEVEAREEGQG